MSFIAEHSGSTSFNREEIRNDRSRDHVQGFLDQVVAEMVECLSATNLGFVFKEQPEILSTGKMLRSRLVYRLGGMTGTEPLAMVRASAAVEMIHSASLLHDDVIDGAVLRRNMPTFWKKRGVTGAVLLGDMLLFKALDLVCRMPGLPLVHELVLRTGELCEGESEQEIVMQGLPAELEACVRIARRKTGALFAFSAVAGAAPRGEKALAAAREAGYEVGTAYQMADDLLDISGADDVAGKTLGTDAARGILTAAGLEATGVDPVSVIQDLCNNAVERLAPWPDLQGGMKVFLKNDLNPAIDALVKLAISS